MKIVVIDNEPTEVISMTHSLELAFPNAEVLPEKANRSRLLFKDWIRVQAYVERVRDEEAILLLDLALGEQDFADAIRGLGTAKVLRILKPKWVFIAFTRYGVRVQREAQYLEAFDGLLEKGELDALDGDACVQLVKRKIQQALNARAGLKVNRIAPGTVKIIDSLGMRLFRAAFGEFALDEIVDREAFGWEGTVVEALTSGHSGAFMLSIVGKNIDGPQSLVVKVAREHSVIESELRATIDFMGQLGGFTGFLCPLDSHKCDLTCCTGVYYRQARVDGVPLIDLFKQKDRDEGANALKHLLRFCAGIYKANTNGVWGERLAGEIMKLSAIDVGRFETSVSFLVELANASLIRGHWPSGLARPQSIAERIQRVVRGWSDCVSGIRLKTVLQHGDLNLGNVIVRPDGSPILIDLARFGVWHVGYDLSRLRIMFHLRLMGSEHMDDWFPDSLGGWLAESLELPAAQTGTVPATSICPESMECAETTVRVFQQFGDEDRLVVDVGYFLGILWDLVKIVSYQDVSVFKRLWALIECDRLVEGLEPKLKMLKSVSS